MTLEAATTVAVARGSREEVCGVMKEWVKPELRIVVLSEVESIADVDVAYATFCSALTVDM